TTGMSVDRDGELRAEDATLAARNALLNMIDHLCERGWSRQQAYAICSVAVDLKVSQLVDVPSFLVSAFLPEDIFTPCRVRAADPARGPGLSSAQAQCVPEGHLTGDVHALP